MKCWNVRTAPIFDVGPHPEAYHQAVFDRLISVTENLSGSMYSDVFKMELKKIGVEVSTSGTKLNKLVTKE